MIETIFFDLGGVLLNFSHEKMCKNLAAYTKLDLEEIKTIIYGEELGDQYERGLITSEQLYEYLSARSNHLLDFTTLMEAIASIFFVKQETVSILERLKKQNLSLYLLSNTNEAHFSYVKKHFDFLDLFDDYILSYEVKACKPEKEIFIHALNLAGANPENSFYIDDVPEYTAAASKMGIVSHHFQGAEGLAKALESHGF